MRGFDFGKNWQAFSSEHVDEGRIAVAARSLQALLGREELGGASVLDVGCGSGIFAIAAHRLGAGRVLGVDINPRSIDASERNLARLAPGAPVTFRLGSALDRAAMDGLGQFDLVYAWGSLHHTGAMHDAITNTARLVAPGGTLVLAIYNRHITSPIWRGIKWLYNRVPGFVQRLMAIVFAGVIYLAKLAVTRRNPLEKERGMDFWYDVIDWVGGYPYEYASPAEVETFVQGLGLTLRSLAPAQVPTGCNELVFERTPV
ncbi:class I SAM-dependent methyltransferase [Oscillochloris sp. ZM17-4]|uniref:class I SAM-dependent methyltransferase n=1 Tax=Oscillochloris sp. ZM17-4 TaxID=2866714 RepID=UPI001C731D3E|nr:class I SAM-dependent methyltransferase [Oscillochloris sp. ZM17-4]MBX0331031.1 class I SAM-dependent methyltransferase [Oscillochloris sp. ZM17-4]